MARSRIFTGAFAVAATVAAALAMLHLWAARTAPVVRWSDSEIDLTLARSPLAALASLPVGHHPIKPAFILFLKLCLAIAGSHDPGRVVVAANACVWLAAIAAAGLLVGRSGKRAVGWGLVLVLLVMLRFRDNASAVMSECLTAAILLALLAAVLALRRISVASAAGLAGAVTALFWIRPNIGAVAIALTVVLGWRKRTNTSAIAFVALLFAINVGVWRATRPTPAGAILRGLDYPIALGSIDDAWDPQLGALREADDSAREAHERLAFARESWRRLCDQGLSDDAIRQWSWRAAHGLLGVDYYDASWSRAYQRIDAASREVGVFVLLAAVAILLVCSARGAERGAGLFLVGAVIAQDLIFFSEPRLAAPLVPAILLMAAVAMPSLSARRAVAAGGIFCALAIFGARQPSVLGWPWGRIEKPGVVIIQRIPRGELPGRVPATLHLRLASPLGRSEARFTAALDGKVVYRSDADPCRTRPEIAIVLSDELVRSNRTHELELSVTSLGRFDATNYLLFPVIPPPWRTPARRTGSADLSPSTGMISGSLDWWAHEGTDNVPCRIP